MVTKAQPKKRRGCFRTLLWIVGAIIVLFIIIALVADPNNTAVQTGNNSQTSQNQQATVSPTATPESSDSQSNTTASSEQEPPPTQDSQLGSTSTEDGNKGIVFGEPVTFSSGGFSTVGLLVTNTTDQVKSFTVKATYKLGDDILATAVGAVNDLLPGQMRAASLISQDAIPSQFDSVRVDVDTMIVEDSTTPGASAASKIAFGKPALSGDANFVTVNVEVTNNDSNAHSFTVQSIFLQGEKLIGIGTGAVNDLAAGQTKTASLIVQGMAQNADIELAVETVIQ